MTKAHNTRGTARDYSWAVPRRAWRARIDRLASSSTRANPELLRSVARPTERQLRRVSGVTLTLVGILLLGFVLQVVGISQLRHERDQSLLYSQFRYDLANSTAPVGQVDQDGRLYALGTPVALVAIPALGVSEVVLEGTSSRTLLSGPGHRRDTALPGQAGAAVIMGRQAAYGGPFAELGSLHAGDLITTTTGQGSADYTVTDVRYAGDPQPGPLASGAGRLTLVSATGPAYFADGVVRVDARLVSKPFITPNPVLLVGSLTEAEAPLSSDSSGWLPLLLALELGALAVFLFTVALRRWGRWHTWIVAVPVSLVIGSAVGEQVVVLLPNLY
ncbi:MAG: peptidase sortase [Glaciihabitans sp.]|nr:peptidase sortase [Glaciihabitans sp.]